MPGLHRATDLLAPVADARSELGLVSVCRCDGGSPVPCFILGWALRLVIRDGDGPAPRLSPIGAR